MPRFKNVSRTSRAGKLRALMVVAPIALELLTQYRNSQKAKRGRLYRPSKREQMFDSILDQANRRFGRRNGPKRGGFF
ncbi:hypothetical protein Deipr_0379 [Deinococcus proteolyticus MRP]|uniref:Uncharacterized protein n=1 Tax=Deinococcus proteolyticus (strain ATCC 35074 / DSM 20540 / JCM 6276 / NBRC 101906 / NCIMB 13154 / VKM Ac-1939 / CCM 2703 / MRP) TaxID=693977 RepID=F0RJS3_DEIPM|nr:MULTISPECIES: hypothetical protein [Deinococcus]ADY25549.1 hypothetical protein Deipr_0379 [Deinococcus proteolyticus MRP]MCY1701669.1 hypothetical protein [Deinococcus sp. SL84]